MSGPIITGINPTLGDVQGGQTVTLFGSRLTEVTSVRYGVTPAIVFTINSDNIITSTSPAGTGDVFITATNDEGTSATSSSNRYSYIDKPILTSINPSSGSTTGGNIITITGSNFTGTSSVTLGGVPVLNLVVESDTIIKATTPSGSGSVSLIVTNVAGSTSLSGFDYINPPLITSINPHEGPESGSTTVVITGTELATTKSVYVGNNLISFTVNSDTQLTITVPSGTGTVPIKVINSIGTSNGLPYTYVGLPTITSLSSQNGSSNGNENLTIIGNNLSQTTSVEIDNQSVIPLYIISNSQLVVATPSHSSGNVFISVITPGGQSNQLSYTYIDPPNI